jgi:hypothetical protein
MRVYGMAIFQILGGPWWNIYPVTQLHLQVSAHKPFFFCGARTTRSHLVQPKILYKPPDSPTRNSEGSWEWPEKDANLGSHGLQRWHTHNVYVSVCINAWNGNMGVLGSFCLPDSLLLGSQWCAILSLISWANPHSKGMESCNHFVANMFSKYRDVWPTRYFNRQNNPK